MQGSPELWDRCHETMTWRRGRGSAGRCYRATTPRRRRHGNTATTSQLELNDGQAQGLHGVAHAHREPRRAKKTEPQTIRRIQMSWTNIRRLEHERTAQDRERHSLPNPSLSFGFAGTPGVIDGAIGVCILHLQFRRLSMVWRHCGSCSTAFLTQHTRTSQRGSAQHLICF